MAECSADFLSDSDSGMPRSWSDAMRVLAGHRILLIGGGGFIGHHLSTALVQCGAAVSVLDNLMVNNVVDHLFDCSIDPVRQALYRQFLMHRVQAAQQHGVRFYNIDARNHDALAAVFLNVRPTKVVHMAAVSSALKAKISPGLTFDLQLNTLRNVLEIVRLSSEPPEQVMLMSSSTVYGNFDGKSVTESSTLVPRGIYANTKYMAERLLRTYRDQYDVGCTIVRPSALYGEWCVSRRVSQVFIENALMGKTLPLEGGGTGWLDFTYIDDLVQGMVRALAFYTYRSDTFNLTFGSACQVKDLVSIIHDIVPNVVVEERQASMDRPVRGTLSIDKARERLGYAPNWALDKGYRRFCEHYAEQWQRAQRAVEQGQF